MFFFVKMHHDCKQDKHIHAIFFGIAHVEVKVFCMQKGQYHQGSDTTGSDVAYNINVVFMASCVTVMVGALGLYTSSKCKVIIKYAIH